MCSTAPTSLFLRIFRTILSSLAALDLPFGQWVVVNDWPEVSDLMTGVTWSTHDIQHRSFAFLRCFFLAKLDIIDITSSTTFHPSVHKNQSLIYDMIWPTNRALSHNWEKSCHQRFSTPKMPMHNIPKVQIHSTKDAIHRRWINI